MATVSNIAQYIGSDKTYRDTIVDSNGVAIDITGWNVEFVVHAVGNSSVVYIHKSNGSGISLTDPTQGVLEVQVDAADTEFMFAGQYEYYIRRTDAGEKDPLTVGLLSLGAV